MRPEAIRTFARMLDGANKGAAKVDILPFPGRVRRQ